MAKNPFEVPPMRTIETARLQLRTLMMSDLDGCLPIVRDPHTMLYTSACRPLSWKVSSAQLTYLPSSGLVGPSPKEAEDYLSFRCLGSGVFNFIIILKPTAGSNKSDEVVVGKLGSYRWPYVGYLMHPDHAGKGYATEALRGWIPEFWKHMPSPSEDKPGFDYIEAMTDGENYGSGNVLLKSGFTLFERQEKGFNSPTLGLRDTNVYRIARPGTKLEESGKVDYGKADPGFAPRLSEPEAHT